jgi:transcriptional regulator GlxA family with amidase domain
VKPGHEYQRRVDRVIDHVYEHLAGDLTLAGLARVAAFSPFHFHRVFWQPDDRPCYELYRGNPTVDATKGVFHCDLCLPVRPL